MSILFNKIASSYDVIIAAMGLANEEVLLNYVQNHDCLEVADIGGGTGTLATMLSKKGAKVTLIDPCKAMKEVAKRKNPHIRVINAYSEAIPVKIGTW
jgi:ubiquinone/menaquinone biosynthesis C-methylase UbiE